MKFSLQLKTSIIALLLSFGSINAFAQADLISSLTKQLGVSEKQASGGAGALFNMAQGNLSGDDFSSVKDAVPGITKMMKDGDIDLGGISSMMGGAAKGLEGLAKVNAIFDKLGISPEMVQKFMPIILDYVKGSGGSSVSNLLAGAFK
ncbi:MAG: DUF2780 domain-containing protein [Flavobacteriales bacterium]|nr:DUF2780 domain-containing protein [Flavobacteriales bacterium]